MSNVDLMSVEGVADRGKIRRGGWRRRQELMGSDRSTIQQPLWGGERSGARLTNKLAACIHIVIAKLLVD